jgi:hypothetical protein
MRHGHVPAIHFVVMHVLPLRVIQVRDQLVAEEVEIHPLVRTTPFRATENAAVEFARRGEVMNGNREMKGLEHH